MTIAKFRFLEMVPLQLKEIAKQLAQLNENIASQTKQNMAETKEPKEKMPETVISTYLTIELYQEDDTFGACLSDNEGRTGIDVKESSPEKVAVELAKYIANYYHIL